MSGRITGMVGSKQAVLSGVWNGMNIRPRSVLVSRYCRPSVPRTTLPRTTVNTSGPDNSRGCSGESELKAELHSGCTWGLLEAISEVGAFAVSDSLRMDHYKIHLASLQAASLRLARTFSR